MLHPEIYLLASAFVALFGLGSAFSFLSEDHRSDFLGSDRDGLDPLVLGAVVFALGLVADRFNPIIGNVLKSIGLVLFAFGALILIPTEKFLQPVAGIFYGIVAVAAYIYGTVQTTGLVHYNMNVAITIVPFVVIATFAGTLAALAFASSLFKDRLAQDDGGSRLLIAGLALVVLAPLGALVVTTAAVGALIATLGFIVLLNRNATQAVLAKPMAFIWLIVMVLALVAI